MSKASLLSFQAQGLSWPEKVGDLILMGPVNQLGSWRYYAEPQRGGGFGRFIFQVKVGSNLKPIASFSKPCTTKADHALWEKLVKQLYCSDCELSLIEQDFTKTTKNE